MTIQLAPSERCPGLSLQGSERSADGNPKSEGNEWRRSDFGTGASGPFPPGVPFAPCLRFGNLASEVAGQTENVVDDGTSLAKKPGSSAKDAVDSLF